MEQIKKRFKLIKELKNNWDYHGAKPISRRVIRRAKKLALWSNQIPYIIPTVRNSIILQYKIENGYILYIEVFSKIYNCVIFENKTKNTSLVSYNYVIFENKTKNTSLVADINFKKMKHMFIKNIIGDK